VSLDRDRPQQIRIEVPPKAQAGFISSSSISTSVTPFFRSTFASPLAPGSRSVSSSFTLTALRSKVKARTLRSNRSGVLR
jgi:hypothetical protein